MWHIYDEYTTAFFVFLEVVIGILTAVSDVTLAYRDPVNRGHIEKIIRKTYSESYFYYAC